MDSAREKNDEAKEIYNKENATSTELQKANDYLQSALLDIKNANLIVKEIFGELEQYRIEKISEAKNIRNTENNNSSVANGIPGKEKKAYPEGEINDSSRNKSEDRLED